MYSTISVQQSDEIRTKLDHNWWDSYQTVGDSQTKLFDPTPGQQSDESRTVRNWIEICLTPV